MPQPSVDATAQFRHARARVFPTLQGLPVVGGLRGRAVRFVSHMRSGDHPSPQVFVDHPRVNTPYSINADEVGLQASAPALAARVPVAGWDGEPSALAPAVTKVV